MRNLFKIGIVALTIAVTAQACNPPKTNVNKTEVDSLKKALDTGTKTNIDTTRKN